MFLITSIIVGLTFFAKKNKKDIMYSSILFISLAQIFTLFPGISRSGVTISVALLLGIQHEKAARFSFFMAIPIIIGATLLEFINIDETYSLEFGNLIAGFITAAVVGYFSISLLIKLIDKRHFWRFSFYLWFVGFIINNYV